MVDVTHDGYNRRSFYDFLFAQRLILNEFYFLIVFQSKSLYGVLGKYLKLVSVWLTGKQF